MALECQTQWIGRFRKDNNGTCGGTIGSPALRQILAYVLVVATSLTSLATTLLQFIRSQIYALQSI